VPSKQQEFIVASGRRPKMCEESSVPPFRKQFFVHCRSAGPVAMACWKTAKAPWWCLKNMQMWHFRILFSRDGGVG